jgi:hypothetical protein
LWKTIKSLFDKPTANITLNRQKLKREKSSLSPLLFKLVFEALSRERKRNKGHPHKKGRSQIILVCRCQDFYVQKKRKTSA